MVYANSCAIYFQIWSIDEDVKKWRKENISKDEAIIYLVCAIVFLYLCFVNILFVYFATNLKWWKEKDAQNPNPKIVSQMTEMVALHEWKSVNNRVKILSFWTRLRQAVQRMYVCRRTSSNSSGIDQPKTFPHKQQSQNINVENTAKQIVNSQEVGDHLSNSKRELEIISQPKDVKTVKFQIINHENWNIY